MSARYISILAAIWVAITLGGCASAPERVLSREPVRYATLPNGKDPLNPERLAFAADTGGAAVEGLIPAIENRQGRALNILELSGGGQYGAFGAGFLKGWTATGKRPKFDIVTGVSTGALLATHAFLGTPADDATLEDLFTGIRASDIYVKKGMLGLLWGRNAIYDTAPLQAQLDKHITPEVLQRVALAYDQGRRLYVGTTNLDYNQTWVWSLGLIAKEGTPDALELFKKVLRASAAPPIAFPPVEIEGHLFVDGGVRQNLVVAGFTGAEGPTSPKFGPGNVFVVLNGQHADVPYAVRNDARHIAGSALGAMLDNSTDSMLIRSYAGAKLRGYRFKFVAIPDDADVGHDFLAFDPDQMRASFDVGYELGQTPDPWQDRPPVVKDLPDWVFGD